ncbi:hypothetical protein EDB89DRAFT_1907641 [Lactarius sanguifluus]|nr:hypothetical protein EDB89DRAFT_1907641 [Lactarius sanguifluus]
MALAWTGNSTRTFSPADSSSVSIVSTTIYSLSPCPGKQTPSRSINGPLIKTLLYPYLLGKIYAYQPPTDPKTTVVAAILFTTSGEGCFNVYGQWVGFLNRKAEVRSSIESPLLRNPSKPRKLVANNAHCAMLGDPTWLRLRSFSLYREQLGSLLTTGLALSAFTDLIITAGLCHYLRALNQGLNQTKKMLSTVVSFADNNGALTWFLDFFLPRSSLLTRIVNSLVALVTLWVVMPTNLIYLGLHFTIGKYLTDNLGDSLNMRDYVKRTVVTTPEIVNIICPSGPTSWRSSTSFPVVDRSQAQWSGFEPRDEVRTGAAGVSPM